MLAATGYVFNLGGAFHRVAREHAARTALSYPSGEKLTYQELNQLSNRIARTLLELGIRKGDVVCLFSSKSPNALAAVLACLKIGAPYANLDVSSPWQRISKMLERSEPRLVLHDHDAEALAQVRESWPGRLLDLRSAGLQERLRAQSPEDLPVSRAVTGADPAYIMFTSGSTGFPKGAVMSHANVLNFIGWAQDTFAVAPADVFTNVNPIYFDNSVFDLYASLFSGASLCPVATDLAQQPAALVRCINDLGCTIWFSVPSMLVYLLTTKALGPTDLGAIRSIVFGGEGFPKAKLRELYRLFGHRASLVNVYGPTECTCICSSYRITQEDVENQEELAPLGEIAPNFGYRIDPRDAQDQDFGELLLSGPNVGLGYYNDPERTQKAFVQDPRHRYRSILYRTGDLVRRAPNGHLHFCGRADNQIKHMGYRIELEEIEAGFNSLGYVNEVAVVYKKDQGGLGQIVAFVSCAGDADAKRLSRDIGEVVAPYMVPRKIRVLDMLPKNANGKIDRTRLKDMA